MENAGTEETEAEAERKGLGTPATRAGIIEKMVKTGFAQRKGKQLVPMAKGQNLVAILPEQIKSPMLTSEWEYQLSQIEKGILPQADFLASIGALTHELVKNNAEPNPEYVSLFAKPVGKSIGKCPRCGLSVFEGKKGFFCESRDCGFAMWKDSKFFTAKKKKLDAKIAAALIADGRISLSNLFSAKTGKTYSATVVLENTGKYVNFKLDFGKGGKK